MDIEYTLDRNSKTVNTCTIIIGLEVWQLNKIQTFAGFKLYAHVLSFSLK